MAETADPRSAGTVAGPLALVLPGGGARAAYQVGVLTSLAERAGDGAVFPIVVGVSAGAINAAALAANCERRPGEAVALVERAWLGMSTRKVFRSGPAALGAAALKIGGMFFAGGRSRMFAARGLLDTRPLRRTLSGYIDAAGIAANLAAGRLRALALTATSYSTGRTVTFIDGAEEVRTWRRAGRVAVRAPISVDHVLASCAVPLVFPAVQLGDEYFGDGSLRQVTPLAPAVHLGSGSVLAISVRRVRNLDEEAQRQIAGYPPSAQILGMLFNSVFLDALDADAERLERINRSLAALPTGASPVEGLRPIRLAVVSPSRDLGRLAAGLEHSLPRSLRLVLRALGTRGLRAPDLLSYLLFERPYIERMLELGREDGARQWDRIAPLLEAR